MEYKTENGLLVSRKSEAFLYRIYPALINFPKAEKFALCSEIKQNAYSLIRYIEMANSVKSKRFVYAQEADGYLQTLKVLIKLARNQQYISKGFFREYKNSEVALERKEEIYRKHNLLRMA